MEKEIDLRDLLVILRRRLWLIALLPIVSVLIAAVMVFFVITPVYEASTTLLVGKNETSTQASLDYQSVLLNAQLVKTYGEIAKSRSVAEEVISMMGISQTPDQIRAKIGVSVVTGTQVIRLTVTDTDPMKARQIANVAASVFVKRVPALTKLNNLTVVDTAITPIAPVKPKKSLTLAVAAMLGLMLGLGAAFLLEYMDNTFKSKDDIESILDLPVLGLIPKIDQPS